MIRSQTGTVVPATLRSYRFQAAYIREYFGPVRLSEIDTQSVEAFVTWLQKRTGTPTIIPTLQLLRRVLKKAVASGLLPFNAASPVDAPPYARPDAEEEPEGVWDDTQARTFLATADSDRLAAAWRLTFLGLRRGEVCGLRWSDIDFGTGTLTVRNNRSQVGSTPMDGPPKSAAGRRTLPLPQDVAIALQEFQLRQQMEAHDAASAYRASGYVVVDELGAPITPARYSREFHRLAAQAGLPRIRLHNARHSANSMLALAGVEPHVRARWMGHSQEVNISTYTKATPADLVKAREALDVSYAGTAELCPPVTWVTPNRAYHPTPSPVTCGAMFP